MQKRAFTIIELILMVVVMGIAFSTLPAILGISAKSLENIVDIRGFYHGAAKMKTAISKPWDQSNVDDYDTSGIYYALRTVESDTSAEALYCDNDKNRSGHYPGLNRRMCEAADASAIGNDGEAAGNYNDIDDFDADNDSLGDGYDIDTAVQYITYQSASPVSNLQPAPGTSNIKLVTITVSKGGKTLTSYKYYAANIGLPKPFVKPN